MTREEKIDRPATHLSRRLLWSHAIPAAILLAAVAITLSGLIGMNAMIAEVKNEHLADFAEEEQVHRSAWVIEVAARHGSVSCDQPDELLTRIKKATDDLSLLLREHQSRLSPSMARAATAYRDFGARVTSGDVCRMLRDVALDRERLLLDEDLTDSWITKLRELRMAISANEQTAQRLGTVTTIIGLSLAVLSLLSAGIIARSVARGVTDPLALIASHARRLGEGDFSPLPRVAEPYEVAQLSRELDRMRARLSEVNQLKEAFLGSVSHDLRTPLAHMREGLSLLVDGTVGVLNPKQHRVASLALRACEREIRLVSALLDLSRIRSGKPLRIREGQRMDEIITRAMESVQDAAQRRQITLEHRMGVALPELWVDSVLIETALANVLHNAIAATPQGGTVRVQPEVSGVGPEGSVRSWLCVVVRDEGPGVAADIGSKIFEPFFTTKSGSESGGSGLGLPLAREMLRAHGGDLTLLNQGTTGAAFALWLPSPVEMTRDPMGAEDALRSLPGAAGIEG